VNNYSSYVFVHCSLNPGSGLLIFRVWGEAGRDFGLGFVHGREFCGECEWVNKTSHSGNLVPKYVAHDCD